MKMTPRYRTGATALTAALTAAALAALVSCSAGDDPAGRDVRQAPTLRFTACVRPVADGVTRAYFADKYNDAFPGGTPIDVFLYDSDGRDLSKEQFNTSQKWIYTTTGEVDAASGRSLLTQTKPEYQDDPDESLPKFPSALAETGYVDVFAAFFPKGCLVSHEDDDNFGYDDIVPATDHFLFSVHGDQTDRDGIVASDFLANDVTSTFRKGSSAINLEMKHRMAKVQVVFNPVEDLTQENMPVGSYDVLGVATQLKVCLQPGGENVTGDISTTDARANVKASVGEPFFLPPQELSTSTPLLRFNLRNVGGSATGIKNVTYTPSTAIELRAGVSYVLTLNVGVRYVTLTTTVRDWTDDTLPFDKIIL